MSWAEMALHRVVGCHYCGVALRLSYDPAQLPPSAELVCPDCKGRARPSVMTATISPARCDCCSRLIGSLSSTVLSSRHDGVCCSQACAKALPGRNQQPHRRDASWSDRARQALLAAERELA